MKLRSKEEALSNSLLNHSQIKEDDDANKNDVIKSKMIIRATKTPNIFNQKEFRKNIAKETENVLTDTVKKNQKPKRKIPNKLKRYSTDDSINNSFLDLALPRKKLKESNITNSTDGILSTCSSKTKSIEILNKDQSNPSKRVSFDSHFTCVSNDVSSHLPFKTPSLPNKSRSSFKSPICASSPIFGASKARNSLQTSDSDADLFSSQIISSSEEFKSQRSSGLSSKDSVFSPIRESKSDRLTTHIGIVTHRKTASKSLEAKKKVVRRKKTRQTFPMVEEPILRTRSGRQSRTYAQSNLVNAAVKQ